MDERSVDYFKHYISAVGEHPYRDAQGKHAGGFSLATTASHLGELTIELTPSENRDISSMEIAARWRELTGPIPDALELSFAASLFSQGKAIDVQLTGSDIDEAQYTERRVHDQTADVGNGLLGLEQQHVVDDDENIVEVTEKVRDPATDRIRGDLLVTLGQRLDDELVRLVVECVGAAVEPLPRIVILP